MPKTDKELTVEILCAHINAWGTQDECTSLTDDDLPPINREHIQHDSLIR